MNRLALVAACLCACSSPVATNSSSATDATGGDIYGAADVPIADEDGKVVDDTLFSCTTGQIACFNETTSKICVDGAWKLKETCNSGDVCADGNCLTPTPCTAGATLGCDGFSAEIHCNAAGTATFKTPCTGQQLCIDGKCQTTACTPYVPECASGSKTSFHTCLPDGSGYGDVTDCKAGSYCFAGKCVSLCEQGVKFGGNVGCEYWSVDLDNDSAINPGSLGKPTTEMIPHSVLISNPGQFDATMSFTIQATCADGSVCAPTETTCNNKKSTVCSKAGPSVDLVFADYNVPAGKTKEFKMPVMNVAGSGVMRKAIHIKSTQPVVAYQGNPYHAEGATSNDGSLLLPQNTLGKTYFAVVPGQSRGAMMGFPANSAFLTVVATQVGTTTVTVTPTRDCQVNYALGVPGDGTKPAVLSAGKAYTFQILQFDVLNIEEGPKSDQVPPNSGPQALVNMTGSKIEADKPVAVFSGHQAAGVEDDWRFSQSQGSDSTWDTCCTEHMEEQLMPVEFWGTEAFCVKTKPRGDEVDEFVVVAGEDNVQLTTDPPSVAKYPNGKELNGVTLMAGQRARVQTDTSFMLKATGKIQVAQLLVSAGQAGPKNNGAAATLGDASMAIVPASTQYRPDYTFQTPDGFTGNYVTVVRPQGLALHVDGTPLTGSFQSFGDGTWEFAYLKFNAGTHTIENLAPGGTPTPFGLMVYGYGGVTAYSFPGGMILK